MVSTRTLFYVTLFSKKKKLIKKRVGFIAI